MLLPLRSHLFLLTGFLIFTPLVAACPPLAQSQINPSQSSPNSVENPTEEETPGWGKWQPISEIEKANISAGFSNLELGGFEDLRYSCAERAGMPADSFPNWFRLDYLIEQIGTGNVEYGCLIEGEFISTMTITAVKNDLADPYCLEVIADSSINIYSEPNSQSTQVGTLTPGDTVQPDSAPASVTQTEGENWVMITKPAEGWVLQGRPETEGNLRLCESK
jgi:hypothetical protein